MLSSQKMIKGFAIFSMLESETEKQFLDYYDPTIEDQYIQHCEVDGNWVIMDVLDTAGQEEFSAMREQYMRNGRGFPLVFSVTERKSLDEAVKLYRQIDLTNQRVVTEAEGRSVAANLKLPYIETSAKDPPVNVDAAFHELVRIVKSFPSDEDEEENSNGVSPNRTKAKKKKVKQKCVIM
ncbi:Ras family protein [Ancylostoma caninum]|uniref:Ras family protein n=1 Tax=Ancylostoma caninum TaxID=29170 RepID=A0A368FEU5_ANCCA|nr:Ras family protein [Ancylostoma caninum]